jgi:hypothetical protein
MEIPLICPVCEKPAEYLERYYDRHGIYSGRACSEQCSQKLPGQGIMRDYEADEPIEEDGFTILELLAAILCIVILVFTILLLWKLFLWLIA